MSTRALALGSPRLIEGLPCTLQPNAVLLAAPPSNRFLSACASGLVYTALGTVLVVTAADQAPRGTFTGTRRDIVFTEPAEPRPLPPLPPPVRVAGNNLRPPDAVVTQVPVASDQVPDFTPTTLPTVNHAHDGQFTEDMAISKEGTGRVVETRPLEAVRPPAAAPVTVEQSSMRVLFQVQPSYPSLARIAKIQGPVVLLMTVDAQGVPSEVQVVSGPHPTLCNEAMRVARLWRFEAARVDGQAVAAQFRLTVVFRLS